MTREEAERLADFWGVNDPETLVCTMPDEAIGDYLDECEPLPETVTLQAFARMKPGRSDCGHPADDVLERLEENCGNPDTRKAMEPTEGMKLAEVAFLEAILAEYKPYACEEIYSEEVDIYEWCKRTGYKVGP
jgi:hypothetical protein